MSALQKCAVFNLAVVAVTAVVVLALFPFLGKGASGGLGLLGFLGLTPLFFRRRAGQVVIDERDALIQLRSMLIAYSVCWVVFVVVVCLLPLVVPVHEVPIVVVQLGVAACWMLLTVVQSVVVLVAYARGHGDAG